MARPVSEQSERVEFRIRAEDKARIVKAANLSGIDLTSFVRQQAMLAAEATIERAERVQLSERDAQRLIAYLDNPPVPNPLLREAARSLPKDAIR
ncbi:MAG: DUF1778 domain-containing protein [Thermomicrobiales bacterium]